MPFAEATKTVLSVIGTCRNTDFENKHGETVLRSQDEWLFSSVIQKHSGEYAKQRPQNFHQYEPRVGKTTRSL